MLSLATITCIKERNIEIDEENIIVLNDEDGNKIEFEFLDLIPYHQKEYVVRLSFRYPSTESNCVMEKLVCRFIKDRKP